MPGASRRVFLLYMIFYSIDIFLNLPIKIIYLQWPIGNFALARKDRQVPVIRGVAKRVAFGEKLSKIKLSKKLRKVEKLQIFY